MTIPAQAGEPTVDGLASARSAAGRHRLRSVALPTEHGGWSLSAEPALLGLLAAPSTAGALLVAAMVVAFMARTPLRLVLVDLFRRRWLDRTRLAAVVAGTELVVLIGLLGGVAASTDERFWWPFALAAPLVGIELWYDMHSRGRRLAAELSGSIGIASSATVAAVAGGASTSLAIGLWVVMAARNLASIPHVRVQVRRSRGAEANPHHSDIAQVAAAALALAGWLATASPTAGAAMVSALALWHLVDIRRPPHPVAFLGASQLVIGLTVVLVTGLAAAAP